ncbi:MAG: LysR substrate-binding domain-containing protein [Thermoanaerobaculia bacterium]|nr:LysR substrate-binding domain-containing protein [Thermoanaerobaculia bacterium]
MKDLPLNSLRAFAVVFARGGVRAAARELETAHSSVSRHLRELESWLGVELVARSTGHRKLTLTPQGEALGRATLAGLRSVERAVGSVRESRSSRSVAIGTSSSFAVRWLLPRLPRLETEHPAIEVSVVVDAGLRGLESGRLDLVIAMGSGPFPGLASEPLAHDALFPVMSPSYWRRRGRPAEPSDLVPLRLLHDRDPNASWEAWKAAFGPDALDSQKGPRFTSTDLVLRAAALGQGVALARSQLVADDLEAGLLVRPIPDLAVEVKDAYWLLLPRHAAPRRALRTVIAWLEREAAMPRPAPTSQQQPS